MLFLSGREMESLQRLGAFFPAVAIPNTTYTIISQLHEGQIINPTEVLRNSGFFSIWHLKLLLVITTSHRVISNNVKFLQQD